MFERNSHRFRLMAMCAAVAMTLALGGSLIANRMARAAEPAKAGLSETTLAPVESLSQAFRGVAKLVKPGVVQITSSVTDKKPARGKRRGMTPEEMPPELREFFEKFGGGRMPKFEMPDEFRRPSRSSGSGWIIDAENGLIITNNHVIGGGDGEKSDDMRLDVTLHDGRKLKATVVGRDPKTDLALIQIKADKLTALKLGDSDAMEVGDWVLAIGAPFGLEQSVTQGIISAKGRSSVHIVPGYEDFIQTDAAINPGNSGGPLVNMKGEVIGVNTAIATNGLAAGYMGVGFAIPSKLIHELLPALKKGEEIVRGYLGVGIKDLAEYEPGFEKTFGLDHRQGVLIENVYSHRETPASKAGLRAEDVILEYNGKRLESAKQLQDMVAKTRPGTEVKLRVWRDRKEITIPVTIGKQPRDFFRWTLRGQDSTDEGEDEESAAEQTVEPLGMTVEKLTPELAKKYGWEDDKDAEGLLVVTEVEPLGEAGTWGVRPGDLLESVQGKRITSRKDLDSALSDSALKDGVRLRFKTKQGPRTHFLPPK